MKFPIHIISISTDFCVDVHEYIHIHRCLYCVHVATKFPQTGSIPRRQRRIHSPPKIIIIIIWNCLRINKTHICIEIYAMLSISITFMKIDVILMPRFFQEAGCIHFCMDLTHLMHVWLLLPAGTLHRKCWKAKRKRVQLIKRILITYLVTIGRKYRNKMQVYRCNIFQAFRFKMTL